MVHLDGSVPAWAGAGDRQRPGGPSFVLTSPPAFITGAHRGNRFGDAWSRKPRQMAARFYLRRSSANPPKASSDRLAGSGTGFAVNVQLSMPVST